CRPIVTSRAVLVPTAEADPAIDISGVSEYFLTPAGYLFRTPEEAELVMSRAATDLGPTAVIVAGIDPPAPATDRALLDRLGVPAEYVLYLGRVDRNKGCEALFTDYAGYAASG